MEIEKSVQKQDHYFCQKINQLHFVLLLGFVIYMLLGGSTAYGYLGNLAVIAFFLRDDISLKDIDLFVSQRKMTVSVFMMLLFLTQSLNFTSMIFSHFVESVCNALGYSAGVTLKEILESGIYEPTPFYEILLFGFFGPVVEELTIRGYLMRAYQQYSGSKIYAIIITAIIFGMNHGSFFTSVPIMLDALVLGYIAMEYGIFWTMLYHSIENFLASYVFVYEILMRLPVEKRYPVYFNIYLTIALCAVTILILKRDKITRYIRENGTEKRYFRFTVKSVTFILYIVILMLLTLGRISKI